MTRLLAFVFLFGLPAWAAAQEAPFATQLEVFTPLIGKSTGTFDNGVALVNGTREVSWGADHGFVVEKAQWRPNQPPNAQLPAVLHVLTVISWDPAKERITLRSNTNWGLVLNGSYRIEGDRLVGEDVITNEAGEVVTRKVTRVILEDGTEQVESIRGDEKHLTVWKR